MTRTVALMPYYTVVTLAVGILGAARRAAALAGGLGTPRPRPRMA